MIAKRSLSLFNNKNKNLIILFVRLRAQNTTPHCNTQQTHRLQTTSSILPSRELVDYQHDEIIFDSRRRAMLIKKPPNILILSENDSQFVNFKPFLVSLVASNSYTIYPISPHDLTTSSVWMHNCTLLITLEQSDHSSMGQSQLEKKINALKTFLDKGGKVLSLPCANEHSDKLLVNDVTVNFYKSFYYFEFFYERNFNLSKTPCQLITQESKELFYYFSTPQKGLHFASRVFIDSNNKLATEYLKSLYLQILKEYFNVSNKDPMPDQMAKDNLNKYTVYSGNPLLHSPNIIKSYLASSMVKNAEFVDNFESKLFDQSVYFKHLSTKKIGSILLFTKLTESTMLSLQDLPSSLHNLVVVARQQTRAQGNNKNEWLSPLGCCVFTLYLNLNTNDFSPTRLCLLQFAAALSCVQSVLRTPGYEKLSIQVKWPNDIFYQGQVKLGGVLVKSSMLGNTFSIKIGIGLNLNNEHPTECLNRIFRENNLPEWSQEELVAKCMNQFEQNLSLLSISNESSLNAFISEFQENWIHKNQKVYVSHWNEDVEILGINEFGYMRVRKLSDHSEHCMQPDGNRFDMLQNMIVLRS